MSGDGVPACTLWLDRATPRTGSRSVAQSMSDMRRLRGGATDAEVAAEIEGNVRAQLMGRVLPPRLYGD